MANIKTWLLQAEQKSGEPIEAIVVGTHDDDTYMHNGEQPRHAAQLNRLLTREEGLDILDKEYDNGYGGPDCFPMYAWTRSRIYLIHEYDGATGPRWLPRNPVDCEPKFGGDYG